MRHDVSRFCLYDNATIKQALEVIDMNRGCAVIVIDPEKKVKGTITDGDIRRALLKNVSVDSSIRRIYNKKFLSMGHLETKKKAREFMLRNSVRQVPVIDEDGRIQDIYILEELLSYDIKDNYVIIMAGGLGRRLRPLTKNLPKPMLRVGDKPILEDIIDQFKEYGFHKFLISINYLGDKIQEYFKDGKDFGVTIEYIVENIRLGTAGSIALALSKLDKPFIVINGDILTGIDFDSFINYHIQHEFDITVGVRKYEIKVPYGVVRADELSIRDIVEKPTCFFYINSGVYAVSPEVAHIIPRNTEYNMTDFIKDACTQNFSSGIYHVTEYWTDIGQMEDYTRANEDIKKFF